MAKHKPRQALAIGARLSPQTDSPGLPSVAFVDLENVAAMVVAKHAERRLSGGASGHIVIKDGVVSVFAADATTTVRVAGGAMAITTND